MRILVTAIGSMSAKCVISSLRTIGHFVVGCDIYPREWHYEATLCDIFYQAPLASLEEDYIQFLLRVCEKNNLCYIIPLTDLEIDVINKFRKLFEEKSIVLCMQSKEVLSIVRNKYHLYEKFKDDNNVPSIKTCMLINMDESMVFPCVAKPINGRSSEGLLRNATREQVMALQDKEKYILQEQIQGHVFTVDYCRSEQFDVDVAVPREELLRTNNGAGITIRSTNDVRLIQLTSYIGRRLNINGVVNMEFIYSEGKYYLIDINPRFSAGVAFTKMLGYDMAKNHVNVFGGKNVDDRIVVSESILCKTYNEYLN